MKKIHYIYIVIILIMISIIFLLSDNDAKQTNTKKVKKESSLKQKISKINKTKNINRVKNINKVKKNIFIKKAKITKEERVKLLKDIAIKLVQAKKEYDNKKVANPKEYEESIYTGVLSKKYLKKQIKEIIPEVKNCYTESLKDDPDLAGKLTLEFTIMGDPDLGAIIEKSDILENSMNSSDKFNSCVLDSLYELKLEAPESGGKIRVKYPFNFTKKDE